MNIKIACAALAALLVLSGLALPARAQTSPYEKLLTAADIEGVTKLKGVRPTPKDPAKGAGGDLNFTTAGGEMLILATFGDVRYYDASKKQKDMFNGDVAGVGDAAFKAPKNLWGQTDTTILFRKGARCVSITSFFDPLTGKNLVPMDQLIALAKVVAGRL